MNKILSGLIVVTLAFSSTLAEARKSKSSSTSYSKTKTYKPSKSLTTSSYHSNDNDYSAVTSTSAVNSIPIVQSMAMPQYSAVTLRKAGLRTCASKHCTIVKYLPKGEKVFWSKSDNGFVNVYDTPYWIISLDLK